MFKTDIVIMLLKYANTYRDFCFTPAPADNVSRCSEAKVSHILYLNTAIVKIPPFLWVVFVEA